MKHTILVFTLALGSSLTASAQTFTDQLQTRQPGQGVVTIVEDKKIDSLVNGQRPANAPRPAETVKPAPAQDKQKNTPTTTDSNAPRHEENATRNDTPRTETPRAESSSETDNGSVDTHKKVMRGARKVTGYRVQVFAGGNSRADRQKAEAAGNAVKAKYPNQPVYVHFFSPRWICRVGNYTSLDQAQWMLKQVRAMGYKSATIVKGQITVQN